ncbi:MAG TPA: hypothetical protein VKB01_04190 [Thermomicrobiales bacterium]|nr:hypothetical protein [Thermomicrobiales bacterium]
MSTIHRFRPAVSVLVTVLTFALSAPITVHAEEQVVAEEQILAAEEQIPALAAVAGPSWDESSGYGSVEASRAAIGHDDGVSEYGPTGHEASAAMGLSWDEMSGYGSVEASRAEVSALLSGELISGRDQALAFAAAAAMLWDETSGYGSVEASRAAASALYAPVAGPSWDDTSGYGSVEESRAEMALDRAFADC